MAISDFAITAEQRRRLLRRDTKPWLDFDTPPPGLEPGAQYTLATTPPQRIPCPDGHTIHIGPTPTWWIRISTVQRHRKGFWRARYDMVDHRDPTLYLAPGNGYTTNPHRAIDDLCVLVEPDVRARAVAEFDHQRRLAMVATERRERLKARKRAQKQLAIAG